MNQTQPDTVKTSEDTGTGVILKPSPPHIKSRGWCFTYNNYTETHLTHLLEEFKKLKSEYIIGKEIGESGTPHLQGYVYFKNARSFTQIKNICNEMHVEKAKGNKQQNIEYCSKENNYITNIEFEDNIEDDIDPLEFEWQFDLEKILINTKPSKRNIYWYWSCCGGTGKSTFVRYMCYHHNAMLVNKGEYKDMINQIYECKKTPTIILIDIPRSSTRVSYGALESFKNGIVANSKYETGSKIFRRPHVALFCNFPPADDQTVFSKDRLITKKLCECKEIEL